MSFLEKRDPDWSLKPSEDTPDVFPDWVEEGADGYRRLSIRGFESLTVEALRELREENQGLQAQLEELGALLARLAPR